MRIATAALGAALIAVGVVADEVARGAEDAEGAVVAESAEGAGGAGGAEAAQSGPERQPNIDAGRALTATCVACHGEDGNSIVPAYPSIAGQNARYLFRQMQLMRDGARPPGLMAGQLDNHTDAELADLAAYYEAQTPAVGQADPEQALQLGEAIYRGGLLDKRVSACTACHAPDGSGNALAGFPRLSGQQPDYLIEQLKAYREGMRKTDTDTYEGMMRQNAANLTDGEIAAIAHYLVGLH